MQPIPQILKKLTYVSLVRSNLEYNSPVWDPFLKTDITRVEAVQRRAARFAKNCYQRDASVTAMLKDLKWKNLSCRRKARLILLYNIIHGLVSMLHQDYIKRNNSKTRSNNSQTKSICPKHRNIYKLLFPKTIIVWKKLSNNITTGPLLDSFKHELVFLND